MARFGDLDTQYFDDAGDPLVNGKIYFYETGTTTPKTTYADVNLSVPNTNPVILTAAGRQPNVFFSGVAKAILATSAGVQIQVRDPVGQTSSTFGDPWVASKTYSIYDVVGGSDGQFYVSLASSNINNNPVTTTGYWTNFLLAPNPVMSGPTFNDGYTEEVFAVPLSATPALSPTNGSIQTWTLPANATPTAGTWDSGQSMTIMIDDGSGYTVTWTSLAVTWKTDDGFPPTLNTSGYTAIQLWKVAGVIYGARVGNA